LHLITRLDRGGSAENTLLTVIGLARLGHRVTLASGNGLESRMQPRELAALKARLEQARAAGVKVVVLPSLCRRLSPIGDPMALFDIVRLIRRIRPQVVHTHTSKAGALGRLAARLCRVEAIVHTPHGHIFYGYYGPILSTFFAIVERWLGRMTDALITLTEMGKQDYLDRRIVPAGRLVAIPSGVDLSTYRNGSSRSFQAGNGHARSPERRHGVTGVLRGEKKARRAIGLPLEGPVIGLMGRLVPIKGHRIAVDALPAILQEFPDAQLIFVGEGPERSRLAARAAQLGVADHLHLMGAQPELRRYYAACDLVLQPSLNEGMGRTVVEALAMGKPVIASRVGGLPELIHHGQNGLLISPASSSELADAVCSLLHDPARRHRMGAAACRSVTARYSVDAMVTAIDALYRKLVRTQRRSARAAAPTAAEALPPRPKRVRTPSRGRSRPSRVESGE
jgi:glycosyltransferase involved in cell wall biosynthesis